MEIEAIDKRNFYFYTIDIDIRAESELIRT